MIESVQNMGTHDRMANFYGTSQSCLPKVLLANLADMTPRSVNWGGSNFETLSNFPVLIAHKIWLFYLMVEHGAHGVQKKRLGPLVPKNISLSQSDQRRPSYGRLKPDMRKIAKKKLMIMNKLCPGQFPTREWGTQCNVAQIGLKCFNSITQ